MTRWEYKVFSVEDLPSKGVFKSPSRESIEKFLNELGDAGWEIVNLEIPDTHSVSEFAGVAKRARP
jgi:hypothetical protein